MYLGMSGGIYKYESEQQAKIRGERATLLIREGREHQSTHDTSLNVWDSACPLGRLWWLLVQIFEAFSSM